MQIVGLSGYGQTGKDSVGDILVLDGFIKFSFAEIMRKFLFILDPIVDNSGKRWTEAIDEVGYSEAKTVYPEVRQLLQRLGTEAGRNLFGENVWIDASLNSLDVNTKYVCTDMRFPNEYWSIKELGGIVARVERPEYGPANDHFSETALDGFHFDMIIQNDSSLEDLNSKFDIRDFGFRKEFTDSTIVEI